MDAINRLPASHPSRAIFQREIANIEAGVRLGAAQLLKQAGGAPLTQLEVPGATTMKFAADGPHIMLDQLTRPLTPGETIIVTLLFQKSGGVGIVTLVE